ncbi:MAG: hypothetical protein IZT59_13230 [Verrucomicrobia bacterium]|jgi:hypothetical protein|nr:hypothetical protein [Verrucomicrobiota bacterium]
MTEKWRQINRPDDLRGLCVPAYGAASVLCEIFHKPVLSERCGYGKRQLLWFYYCFGGVFGEPAGFDSLLFDEVGYFRMEAA